MNRSDVKSFMMTLLVHCLRFEMPFNVWCGGCNSMIAKGVRFNAEKKQVGNYYSTKVRFLVFDCKNWKLIQRVLE